jgi:hypothetical protein
LIVEYEPLGERSRLKSISVPTETSPPWVDQDAHALVLDDFIERILASA